MYPKSNTMCLNCTPVKWSKQDYIYHYRQSIGKKIRMIKMDDPYPILPNTTGTIISVDDISQIRVKWDNGRVLSVIPEKDIFVIFEN